MLAYAGLGTIVGLVRAPRYGPAALAALAHALVAALVLLVAHSDRTRGFPPVRALRATLPILLLGGLYALLDVLNLASAIATWDREVQAVETALFGFQPARDWWRTSPSTLWSTLLHGIYFSYYALVGGPALWIALRGTDAERDHVLTRLVLVFMLCYATYALLPVAGPYYEFPRPTGPFVDNLPARLVYASLSGGSSFGAAFPSSHVAATVATAAAVWRVRPAIGRWLIAPAALMTVATVYCAMHYAVDAIAGAVFGLVVGAWPSRVVRTTSG